MHLEVVEWTWLARVAVVGQGVIEPVLALGVEMVRL